MGRSGQSVIGWTSEVVSEAQAFSLAKQVVAYAARRGRFSRPHVLATIDDRNYDEAIPDMGLGVTFTRSGQALAVWTDRARGHFVVRGSRLIGGRASVISTASGRACSCWLEGLASGPGGDAVIAMASRAGSHNVFVARWHSHTSRFGSATALGRTPRAQSDGDYTNTEVAIAANSAEAVAAWNAPVGGLAYSILK